MIKIYCPKCSMYAHPIYDTGKESKVYCENCKLDFTVIAQTPISFRDWCDLIRKKEKIPAIKLIREHLNLGLVEAKEIVELLINGNKQ